jgi:hypothetical protein
MHGEMRYFFVQLYMYASNILKYLNLKKKTNGIKMLFVTIFRTKNNLIKSTVYIIMLRYVTFIVKIVLEIL